MEHSILSLKYKYLQKDGIVLETAREALEQGADILFVGRYVTQSQAIERSVRDFLELTPTMREDVDLYTSKQSNQTIKQKKSRCAVYSFFSYFFIAKTFSMMKANRKATAAIKKVGR